MFVYTALCWKLIEMTEALFISCTAIPAVDVVEQIEQKPGKSVVTAVQAIFWQA